MKMRKAKTSKKLSGEDKKDQIQTSNVKAEAHAYQRSNEVLKKPTGPDKDSGWVLRGQKEAPREGKVGSLELGGG